MSEKTEVQRRDVVGRTRSPTAALVTVTSLWRNLRAIERQLVVDMSSRGFFYASHDADIGVKRQNINLYMVILKFRENYGRESSANYKKG